MVAFHVFGYPIYWYGMFYLLAFVFGYVFLSFVAKKSYLAEISPRVHTILSRHLDSLLLSAMLGVLLGGRLGHILIYDFSYFIEHPLRIFAINKGGMSFIGGILGVIVAFLVFAKKMKLTRKDVGVLFDVLVPAVPFGIMLGRIGNFLNQELYGRPVAEVFGDLSEKTLTLGTKLGVFHIYELRDALLRINTNMLASIFEGFVLLCILQIFFFRRYIRGKMKATQLGGVFLMGYSLVRFLLEYLRQDSWEEFVGYFSRSQYFFLLFFLVGLFFVVLRRKSS